MATSACYFHLLRETNAYNHRLRLVESAKQRGIKPIAHLFALRYRRAHGTQMAAPLPAARPLRQARTVSGRHQLGRKTRPTVELQLVELRKTLPTFGARRLMREFDLRVGHNAIERIWREQGLIANPRQKHLRKQDLAHIKTQWAMFQLARTPRI
jgi:hypothetical protein